MTHKTSKLARTGVFSVGDQSSSLGLWTQVYKSLRAAVIICATLVNTHTHIHQPPRPTQPGHPQ